MSDQSLYEYARNAALQLRVAPVGLLRLSGEDRLAFLQRQTTNDLRKLQPGALRLTVLTSATARILDVLAVLPAAAPMDDAVLLMTLPGRGTATANYLRSRIFFMDKVTLTDESGAWAQFVLAGPQADTVLAQLGLSAPPGLEQALVLPEPLSAVQVLRLPPFFALGYHLLCPAPAAGALQAALANANAGEIDAALYDTLRIEAGLPAVGSELNDSYTPLEAGLRQAISDTKGCYTGQEIIARQITYDKVTRGLAGLRLGVPADPGAALLGPQGEPAGNLTSVTHSPRFGHIALAVLKRPFDQPGSQLHLKTDPEQIAQVVDLPF